MFRCTKFQLGLIDAEIVSVRVCPLPHRGGPVARGQMRAGRMVGRSEHGPHGDGDQSRGQDGPGDELLPHQAKSVRRKFERPKRATIVHRKRWRPYELVHSRIARANYEPLPAVCIDPACPAKTTLKVNPIWAASTVASPASPSRSLVREKAGTMKMSWQSATPVNLIKPVARSRRPTPEGAKLCLLEPQAVGP